ncbi:CPSF A subunit region-domain-containing protein [Spinellus fusiger]|nr:CPSF A subunit region-domain-containing protein [Spinellus fusiger]
MSALHVITAKSSTAVRHAVKGPFMDSEANNLIIRQVHTIHYPTEKSSKGTRIEVYSLNGVELESVYELGLFGRIEALKVCDIPGQDQCGLFVLFSKDQYVVLSYDQKTKSIGTYVEGHLEEKAARRSNRGPQTSTDPQGKVIVVYLYTSVVSVVTLHESSRKMMKNKKGKGREPGVYPPHIAFNSHILENSVYSIACTYSGDILKLVILYAAELNDKYIKTYTINIDSKTIEEHQEFHVQVESSAHTLIPVPGAMGGVIVVGDFSVSYFDLRGKGDTRSMEQMMIRGYGMVDCVEGVRCLLGDSTGALYLMTLYSPKKNTFRVHLELIGHTCVPSTIVCMGSGLVYVGSSQGDSCLIKFTPTPEHTFKVIEEYASLAPIVDFCVFDLDHQGKQTMVCCSGVSNDGSLRIVQGGIKFTKKASVPIPGIHTIWTFSSEATGTDKIILLSFMDRTRLLRYNPNARRVEEITSLSAIKKEKTLSLSVTKDQCLLQVTAEGVWLMSLAEGGKLLSAWYPPLEVGESASITVAHSNASQCVLSCGYGTLVYIEICNGVLVQKKIKVFESEVACLDITISDPHSSSSQYVAVGLWEGVQGHVLELPSLTTLFQGVVSTELAPRAIRYAHLGGDPYLLATLGDGRLVYFCLHTGMTERKEITLGTRCITLHSLPSHGPDTLFAASDRPIIIQSAHGKLTYSAVNIDGVVAFSTMRENTDKDVLIANNEHLILGQIDHTRKVHATKIPLDRRMARRITYHEESKTLAVGTAQLKIIHGQEHYTCWIQIFDASTFQGLATFDLLPNEMVSSMISALIPGHASAFVFVGTGLEEDREEEDKSEGHFMVYQVNRNRDYSLVDTLRLPGAVYDIKPFKNSMIATVDGTIYYMSHFDPYAPKGERIAFIPKHHANIIGISLDTRDDKILVGDLMHSMELLKMEDSQTARLERIAKDYNTSWMMAVKITTKDLLVGADMSRNLFTLKAAETKDTEEPPCLEITGEYQLGYLINRFRSGSLADDPKEADVKAVSRDTFLFATVEGAIGAISTLSEAEHDVLLRLQHNLEEFMPTVGSLSHRSWRTFNNGIRTGEPKGFVDGDLIERFLDLSLEDKKTVCSRTQVVSIPLESLEQLIISLSHAR